MDGGNRAHCTKGNASIHAVERDVIKKYQMPNCRFIKIEQRRSKSTESDCLHTYYIQKPDYLEK